ncbi:MAG: ABC transporter ATP-binding protein [Candidatus Eremiobacteraeota bacterium]|nr:ABC transporter ATP-binding protein [Candidatus Eremiobacteraeota bacterium]MBV8365247.1 ABC transporter ATP-binding protein [Candidatus Eremiobacteraeota bacterium]
MAAPDLGTSTAIAARDVVVRFGGLLAVNGVTLSVAPGEILGLIGPNGAGKTTLLSVMSGTQRPTSGIVWIGDTDITRVPTYRIVRLGVARTFQVVKPFANLTVRENVAVGALYGRHGNDRSSRAAFAAADMVLERVGLAPEAKRQASELTLAGRKRLEIAKALATDPRVLLLDEVMAGLTPHETDRAMDLLRDVNASGVTLVVVEHVMRAIMGISQRVAVLHQGRLIAQGLPQAVVADPLVIEAYLGKRYAGGSHGHA